MKNNSSSEWLDASVAILNGRDKKSCNRTIKISDASVGIVESLLDGKESARQFLKSHFRRHPAVLRGSEERLHEIKGELFDFDTCKMLESSASDSIHVWLKTPSPDGTTKMESITVENAAHASSLHRAGHSLYCRAPASLEEKVIPRVLFELGIGCYSATTDKFRRGEIETFHSKMGHTTDYHADFQENFTIQLTGVKKWSFSRSTAVAPLRGCTPNYAHRDVAEQQLKVLRLGDPSFSADQFIAASNSNKNHSREKVGRSTASKQAKTSEQEEDSSPIYEVVLHPGDVLYHPAGIWHKVECLEDSLAINISLIGASYAEVFCSGLQQFLWRFQQWRAPVCTLSGINETTFVGHAVFQELLEKLPQLIRGFVPADFLPESCGGVQQTRNSNIEVDLDDGLGSGAEGGDGSDGCSEDADEAEECSEPVVRFAVVEQIVPEDLSEGWETLHYRFNPLATLIDKDDLTKFGRAAIEKSRSKGKATGSRCFVIHSSYGNESLESLNRCEVMVCERPERSGEVLEKFLESYHSSAKIWSERITEINNSKSGKRGLELRFSVKDLVTDFDETFGIEAKKRKRRGSDAHVLFSLQLLVAFRSAGLVSFIDRIVVIGTHRQRL